VAQVAAGVTEIDGRDLTTRAINQAIRSADGEVVIRHPDARHNLGVAIASPLHVVFDGPVGWYCASMLERADIEVRGNCGWSVGENMMSGSIEVHGHAGSSAGATIRGGTLVIEGNAGARCGISMKGGVIVVGGSVGYMSGFMMQRGRLVVCGNADEGIGDSMYEGIIYVAGAIASLGSDVVEVELGDEDREFLRQELSPREMDASAGFRKLVAGRKLWNFSKKEFEVWKVAL
jgi:glutamate synthase domain-containing protein 3